MRQFWKNAILGLIVLVGIATGCKKKEVDAHIPPDVVFKTGATYLSGDATVGMQDTLLVGIVVTKTEDDLKSYNVSYAFDGATSTTTFYNYLMESSEFESYSKDVEIITRNQAGTEKWYFTIVDRDGNMTQKTITLTVQ